MADTQAIGEAAGKAAEKGALKTAGKVVGKAMPGVNVAIAAAETTKAVKAGKYGTAAVAAAEGVPGPAGWVAMGAEALGAGKVADKAIDGASKVAKGVKDTVGKGVSKVASKDGMSKLAKVGAMTLPGGMIVGAGSVAHAMAKHEKQPDVQMSKEPIDPKTGLPVSISQARQAEADNPDAKIKDKQEEAKYQKQADAYNKRADAYNKNRMFAANLEGPGPEREHVTAQDMKDREVMEKERQKGVSHDHDKEDSLGATPLRSSASKNTVSPEAVKAPEAKPGRQMQSEQIDPKTGLPLSVARARESEKDNPDAKLTEQDRPKFEKEANLANQFKQPDAKDVTAQDMKYRETAKVKELDQHDPTKRDSVEQLSKEPISDKTGKPQALSLANGFEKDNPNAQLNDQDRQQYQQKADSLNNNPAYQGQQVSAQEMKNFDTMKADYQNLQMSQVKGEQIDPNNGLANTLQQIDAKQQHHDQQNLNQAYKMTGNTAHVDKTSYQSGQDKTMTKDAKSEQNTNEKSEDKDKSNGLGLGKLAVGGGLAAGGMALGSKLMSSFKGMQKGLNKNGKSLQQTMSKMTGDMQKGSKESQAKLQKDMAKMGVGSKGDAKQQANSQSEPSVG